MEAPYKEMYFKLFNEVSDIIEALIKIQRQLEDMYICYPKDNK